MHSQQNVITFFFLIAAVLGITAGEYYFLQIPPADTKLYGLGLKFFAKGGFFFRVLLVTLYPLGFALLGPGLKNSSRVKPKRTTAGILIWLLLFAISALLLLTLHRNPYFIFAYPAGLAGLLLSGVPLGKLMQLQEKRSTPIQNDKHKQENRYSFHFPARDGTWVNVPNPFRGILVIGGAGAGKSASVAEPIIAQAARKNYSGILYDFKFPTLTNLAYGQYEQAGAEVSFWVINFEDMTRTHRVNPLNPRYIPASAYASEYALAIINNLMPETISKSDFWTRSAQALLTATIWYMAKYFPRYCTLPHVINMIVYTDYVQLLKMLDTDYECASMVRSILTAVEMKASNQTAGMVSTLQLGLGRINTPEICYVLSGDEFSLDINDPKDPKVLCIGTSPTLCDTFSPVISCLITVALKLMNQQGKRHSFVMLDEGPTLFVPKFDQLPATARSNKLATIYVAQDLSQMKKENGMLEAEAIVSNLNNQFFGRVANVHTAEYVSRMFGKDERVMRSEGISDTTPRTMPLGLEGRGGAGSYGSSVNYSLQERTVLHPQELLNLEVGHFIGNTVETEHPSFSAHIRESNFERKDIPEIASSQNIQLNYKRIIEEVKAIMEGRITSAAIPGDTPSGKAPHHLPVA